MLSRHTRQAVHIELLFLILGVCPVIGSDDAAQATSLYAYQQQERSGCPAVDRVNRMRRTYTGNDRALITRMLVALWKGAVMNAYLDPADANAITSSCALQGTVAVVAFASNALLCRVALYSDSIDAATFSDIRLLAGGATLLAVTKLRPGHARLSSPDWVSAIALGVFVSLFSLSYMSLGVSTGALVLFGTVQLTIFGACLLKGQRFHCVALIGYLLATVGLLFLTVPGVGVPGFSGLLMMVGAGVAWGLYTLRGMRVASPLSATTGNFLRATPVCIVLGWILHSHAHANVAGVALAVASGAVTSAIGFVVWGAAIRRLTAMSAATVQLLVPPVAAFGGVLFLQEPVSARLVLSSVAVLAGIWLTASVGARHTRKAR
ncbi:DMT family transporter [Cupriavidus pinatubonensis]|uniref:DMT family transporter n=1 Tax=Cupriavidus pinatubonensis TaxID=248026 RepID=UPI001CC3F8AD|nr:DMT family transporter [Cupriavidus pinatubonensis]